MINGFLRNGARAVVAALALASVSAPVLADSFSFGYSSGPVRHYPHHRFGPAYAYRPVYVPPPRVVYLPPPPVAYAPVPYAPAPVALNPASPVYQTADGRYCREYQATVNVNGYTQPIYGTACLQPDGAWHIVN